LIAADDLELEAEDLVHQLREVDHRRARRGRPHDHFLAGQFGDAPDRRGMPDEGNVCFAVRAADPGEPGLVELGACLQERRRGNAVDRNADHRAILGPLVIKLVGHHHPAGRGLILHEDMGITRNVVHEVTGDDAREQIVAATDGRAHDHADLLAPIERSDVALRLRRGGGAKHEEDQQRGRPQSYSPTHRHHRAAACTVSPAAFIANNRPARRGGARQPMRRNASQITA
jgi:hypothetical protein